MYLANKTARQAPERQLYEQAAPTSAGSPHARMAVGSQNEPISIVRISVTQNAQDRSTGSEL
jgi:hypothetical protein